MVLTDKANEYAVKGSAGGLTHSEAKMYYNSCYLKSVGYILGQCFFTDQDCKEIEQDAIQVFTSCTGYNKNMIKVIRDGPTELAGAAMTFRQLSSTTGQDSSCVDTTSMWMAQVNTDQCDYHLTTF
eukprot:11946179-Ditylum_brightwellii.AAC.1